MANNWYYQNEGSSVGPIEEDALVELCKSGTVNAATMVWRQGLSEWMPIASSDFTHKTLLSPPPITQAAPAPQAPAMIQPYPPASKADTFKFSTIIFIIVGLLVPLWPISLPLFWFLAYRSYKKA